MGYYLKVMAIYWKCLLICSCRSTLKNWLAGIAIFLEKSFPYGSISWIPGKGETFRYNVILHCNTSAIILVNILRRMKRITSLIANRERKYFSGSRNK